MTSYTKNNWKITQKRIKNDLKIGQKSTSNSAQIIQKRLRYDSKWPQNDFKMIRKWLENDLKSARNHLRIGHYSKTAKTGSNNSSRPLTRSLRPLAVCVIVTGCCRIINLSSVILPFSHRGTILAAFRRVTKLLQSPLRTDPYSVTRHTDTFVSY